MIIHAEFNTDNKCALEVKGTYEEIGKVLDYIELLNKHKVNPTSFYFPSAKEVQTVNYTQRNEGAD